MRGFYQQPVINPQAQKRLDLIQLLEDLGATMHALEIRGAG
jgi:transcription-repair coupling factor (superfamily II helicase)